MAVFLQFLIIVHLEFITICKQCEIYMKSIFVLWLKIHNIFHIISLRGKIWTQQIGLAPNAWLHSSVGRVSHLSRGGHGSESRWSPDVFQASSSQLLKLENLLQWSLFTFIFNMQTISESETSETVCQDSYLLVDTSLVDIPYTIFDTSTWAVSVTRSCAISFHASFFSGLIKLVAFGTLIH